MLGVSLGLLLVLLAAAAPLLTPFDPLDQHAFDRLGRPDLAHLLGRDTFGRDILSRLLYAGRVSLIVGAGSVALGGAVGSLLGLVAGYAGGWLENLIMR